MNTVSKIQLEIPDLASAQAWDKRLNTLDDLTTTLEVLEGRLDSPLHARRYLQAGLTRRDPDFLRSALSRVQAYGHPGLEGITSKVLVQLGQYANVMKKERALPLGTDDWHLENMLDDEVAQTSACIELGETQQAQAHLHGARLLASLLKMPYQLQWCLLESGRLGLVQGEPKSRMIREALSMISTTARRDAWGRLTLAESLYSEGDGHAAWLVAKELDVHSSEGFATLLGVYLGYETSQYGLQGPGIYAEIARALIANDSDKSIAELPLPESQPARSMVQTLQIAVMANTPNQVLQAIQQAELLLKASNSPMQQTFLLGLLLHLGLNGRVENLQDHLRQFALALSALSTPDYALNVLLRHTPQVLGLLSYSPLASADAVALESKVPLIVGQHLRVDGVEHVLPGRSQGGVQLVRRGFFGNHIHLHHAARSRIQKAVQACGYPMAVNLGTLLFHMIKLIQFAPANERDAWKESAIRLLELIDSRALAAEVADSEIYRLAMKL